MSIRNFVPVEAFSMAMDNIRAHKFRSFLTVLGIVIGIMTVIAISSILTGLRSNMVTMIESYGTSNIYAFHLSTGINVGPRDRSEFNRKPLTVDDGEAIKEFCPAVEDAAYTGFIEWNFDKTLSYGSNTYKRGNLEGVSANYAVTTNLFMSEGRFISEIDDQHKREVIVIGQTIAEALFPHQSQVVGKQVMMAGKPYEIIGVLEKKKTSFLGEGFDDNNMFIPFRTLRKISPRSEFMMIIARAHQGQLRQALDQIEEILRRRRGVKYDDPNNFDLSTADRIVEQFDSITAAIGLIAIALSSVGLLVGGIGVMNIMLVSVTERTQEIGIRKAIGAKRGDIVRQFLFEAMTLTFLGGLLGIVLALLAGWVLGLIFPDLPASTPIWAIVAGLTVSIAIGLMFGVWPARKASRLDPIECLRYE